MRPKGNHVTRIIIIKISNISGCACIPTVKKHTLISEGVLIFECFV